MTQPATPNRPANPPGAPLSRFALPIALALALAPAIVGIWSGRWFVTQDGPAHLYNARVIVESGDPISLYAATYEVRARPLPNWGGHVLYLVLGAVLPPASAERAAVTITLVLLASATAWLRRRVCPGDGLRGVVGTAALAAMLGMNVTWLFGFTGFLLGAALMPLTLALWWDRREAPGWRGAMVLAGLVVLGYFCHPVSLGLTTFAVVVLAVAAPGDGPRWRRIGRTVAGLSPLLPLGLIYGRLTRAGGPIRPEWGFLATSISPRAWFAQLGWADPITIAAKAQRPFGTVSSAWNGLTAPAVWFGLGLLAMALATFRDRRRRPWGLIGLAMVVGGVLGPDTIGSSHGHYLPQRVVLLGFVCLVPWLALDRPGWLAWLGRGCLLVALGFQSLFVWDYAEECRRTAGRLVAASETVRRDVRVAAVLLDTLGRFRPNPLLHADCLLGVGTGNVIWGDYETNYYYFPVQLRDPSASPPASSLEAIARLDGPGNAEERARRWSDLIQHHESAIDVVVIWGSDPAIEAATARRFVRASDDGRVQVWLRSGLD